jgi:hypothetical protein
VDKGEARIGDISINLPEFEESDAGPAVAYVRPYDIEINRLRHSPEEIEARIRFIQGAGAVARLELERLDTQEFIDAEMTRERFKELGLVEGENGFPAPQEYAGLHRGLYYLITANCVLWAEYRISILVCKRGRNMQSGIAAENKEQWSSELELKIREALREIRYGTVTLVIQDGRVVQIDKSEKIRLK